MIEDSVPVDANFWHQRWQSNKIGFHESKANPMLVKHIDQLALKKHARVFIPLCGKTLDIAWLLAQGFRVVGAELSELAIEQLFTELEVTPTRKPLGSLIQYSSENIDIFVGDLFDLIAHSVGPIDAIYDRAALVALPEEMRLRYAPHLISITNNAPQLLVCFEYDQAAAEGPPFSIGEPEIKQHYLPAYDISRVETIELPKGLKGQIDATESAWILTAK